MKTNFTLFVLIFSFHFVNGQGLFNSSFFDYETITCPYDENVEISRPLYWNVYQTQNGEWDGPIDSTRCISVTAFSGNGRVDLDQIDPSLPLFVKSEINDVNASLLDPNSIYRSILSVSLSNDVELNLDEDCANGLCSGLLLGVEIPDSSGQETAMREYRATMEDSGFDFYEIGFCYGTERFATQNLTEFVMKFTFTDTVFTNHALTLQYASNYENEEVWGDYRIYAIEAEEWSFQDTSYNLNPTDFVESFSNFLVMYTDTTYPSPDNLSFIEARPAMNQPTPQTINLITWFEQTIVFQPYARIRGGLVEGSDSIRHEFNLINEGGSFCFEEFIEVLFVGADTYFHESGDLNFHGSSACMMFKDDGTLEVAKDAYLQYGDGGEGILAFGKASNAVLHEGSTLAIDNKVVLLSIVDKIEDQVHIDLQPGSALIFGENASIIQASGNLGNQVINVHMNGGLLDDHTLSAEERRMINKIYPAKDTEIYEEDALALYPNPVGEMLTYRYNSASEEVIEVEILNLKGQLIYRGVQSVFEGMNDLAIPVNTLEQGLFILRLSTSTGIVSGKFIK